MNKKYKFMDILNDAYKNHYAVPAFDYFGMYDAKAMIEVAQELKSPVIMMTLAPFMNSFDAKVWVAFIEAIAEKASVPVFTHVDHSPSVEQCFAAVDAGFDSVMIDASAEPLEENIRKTKLVVDYAHARGVAVEAEMGHIKSGKTSIEGGYEDREQFLVQTNEAAELVKATGVDFLAVGIGNQHGFYVEEPKIHFDRLMEVNEALGIPLVMHGGSGLPRDTMQQSIKNGITKVNVATDIATAFGDALRTEMNNQGEHAMFLRACNPAMEAAKVMIRRWIETCMSSGKA